MHELQWLGASAPAAMLNQVIEAASPRKLRLFACACCRLVWDRLEDTRPRRAVEVGERFADRRTTDAEREEDQRAAFQYSDERGRSPESAVTAWAVVSRDRWVLRAAAEVGTKYTRSVKGRNFNRAQAELLRHLFGNPFRAAPRLPPVVLAWDGGQVVKLARMIYDERRFCDLPVLADALRTRVAWTGRSCRTAAGRGRTRWGAGRWTRSWGRGEGEGAVHMPFGLQTGRLVGPASRRSPLAETR